MFPRTGGRFGVRAFKLILSLLPLLYIGGMLYYLTGFKGWDNGPLASGLGPTVLGLGALGLLVSVWLLARLLRSVLAPGGVTVRKGEMVAQEPAFDADAALARYMARKEAGLVEPPPEENIPRPVFGRKIH